MCYNHVEIENQIKIGASIWLEFCSQTDRQTDTQTEVKNAKKPSRLHDFMDVKKKKIKRWSRKRLVITKQNGSKINLASHCLRQMK